MNRGVDCKDTVYEVTFPSNCEESLKRLSFVLEGLLTDEDVEVHTSGSVSSIIIAVYEDLV